MLEFEIIGDNMTDVFVSYARNDRKSVSTIVEELKTSGYQVWWDSRLQPYQDFGVEIETALKNANCAIVAWSTTARNSLWVRAEATFALEAEKLVQLSIDGSKPPLPFTMIHLLDFADWNGKTNDPIWCRLEEAVRSIMKATEAFTGTPRVQRVRLAGLGPTAAVGGASLGLVLVAGGVVGMSVTNTLSTNLFELISEGMFLAALLAFAHMLTKIIKTALASR